MAIDTATKRASLIGFGLPFRLTLPFPDGTIDVGDRAHLLGLYAGFEGGVVPPPYIFDDGDLPTYDVPDRLRYFDAPDRCRIFNAPERVRNFDLPIGGRPS